MDLKKLSEPFPESDIEWRLGQVGETNGEFWAKCLAYISARAVMDRLDEVCGLENWQVEYIFPAGGVICRLGIKIGDHWVWKQDGAEPTDIEQFKGAISGALKRAGSVWSIARYLYRLESGWATICEKKTPGAIYGKTKEGKSFYWVPPRLPAWALPSIPVPQGGEPKQPNPSPTPQTKNTATGQPAASSLPPGLPKPNETKASVGAECLKIAEKLKVPKPEFETWAMEFSAGAPIRNMTLPQLKEFRSALEGELGRMQ